jgi:hypothetical protein
MSKVESADPLDINGRLYKQLGVLLDVLEDGSDTTLRERIEIELNARRQTDATLRDRIVEALADTTGVTWRERIAAMSSIATIQKTFVALRKETNEPDDRGSAVRKYATAFQKPDAARGGKGSARPARKRAAAVAVAADDDDDEDSAA